MPDVGVYWLVAPKLCASDSLSLWVLKSRQLLRFGCAYMFSEFPERQGEAEWPPGAKIESAF